jgi:hypothetical protein
MILKSDSIHSSMDDEDKVFVVDNLWHVLDRDLVKKFPRAGKSLSIGSGRREKTRSWLHS